MTDNLNAEMSNQYVFATFQKLRVEYHVMETVGHTIYSFWKMDTTKETNAHYALEDVGAFMSLFPHISSRVS